MIGKELPAKYFPSIDDTQLAQFEKMGELYPEWNEKINVISRKDIENLYVNHIIHSLTIAKFLGEIEDGTTFLDLGTGGGFPGIPLAVLYPKAHFHLIDRIGKKLKVAEEIARAIGLTNVTFQHGDAGECHSKFDYVVSRAVMSLDKLVKIVQRNVTRGRRGKNSYDNGIICLKGGDLTEESRSVSQPVIEFMVNEFFSEAFFDTKKLVYVPFK